MSFKLPASITSMFRSATGGTTAPTAPNTAPAAPATAPAATAAATAVKTGGGKRRRGKKSRGKKMRGGSVFPTTIPLSVGGQASFSIAGGQKTRRIRKRTGIARHHRTRSYSAGGKKGKKTRKHRKH